MVDVKRDEIRVGDTIAVSFRSSTISYQRVGVVQMIDTTERTLDVEWLAGWSLPNAKVTTISYDSKKIVRL